MKSKKICMCISLSKCPCSVVNIEGTVVPSPACGRSHSQRQTSREGWGGWSIGSHERYQSTRKNPVLSLAGVLASLLCSFSSSSHPLFVPSLFPPFFPLHDFLLSWFFFSKRNSDKLILSKRSSVAQCGGTRLQSQSLGGWGQRIESLRTAWHSVT